MVFSRRLLELARFIAFCLCLRQVEKQCHEVAFGHPLLLTKLEAWKRVEHCPISDPPEGMGSRHGFPNCPKTLVVTERSRLADMGPSCESVISKLCMLLEPRRADGFMAVSQGPGHRGRTISEMNCSRSIYTYILSIYIYTYYHILYYVDYIKKNYKVN